VVVGSIATIFFALLAVAAGWRGWFAADSITSVTDSTGQVQSVTTQSDPGAARDGLLRLATACGVVTAGLLAWGRLELSRDEHRLARATDERAVAADERATAAHRLSERGQATERYTRAVEQLGSGDPAVRVGALYALERIAHDSPDDRDNIYDVVCAWIRHHSVQRDDHGEPITTIDKPEDEMVPVDGYAVDYRAAVTIALRPRREWVIPRRDLALAVVLDMDLSQANLNNVNFGAAHLRRVQLGPLHTVSFEQARIGSAVFHGSLSGVEFNRASLTDVVFHAPLRAVEFWDCSVSRGRFEPDAEISDSRFAHRCRIRDVAFRGPLTGVDYIDSTLDDVRFVGPLRNVEFEHVSGTHVGFRRVVADRLSLVEQTTLTDVNLTDAALTNGQVSNSALTDVTFGPGAFDDVTFAAVRLDEGVDPGADFRQTDGLWYSDFSTE
jgi:uncharacterized protein YjbI with pentapeptide repeats